MTKLIKTTLVLSFLFIITACSILMDRSGIVTKEENRSYQALLFVNGKEFHSVGETANELELVVEDFIGSVKEKIDIEIRPTVEFTSNYLEEGTEIYSVKGNSKIVLAKKDNGNYEVFE